MKTENEKPKGFPRGRAGTPGAAKQDFTCDECSIVFQAYASGREKAHHYCTRKCQVRGNKRLRGHNPDKIEVECARCGKTKLLAQSLVRDVNYCDRECWRLRAMPPKSQRK